MTPQTNQTNRWWNGAAGLLSFLNLNPKTAQQNRRAHDRMKTMFRATISGSMGAIPVTGIDLHHQGLCVVSNVAIAREAVVFVHLSVKRVGLWGFAHVRHCTQRNGKFYLGLEFRAQPMREEIGEWQFERVSADTAA